MSSGVASTVAPPAEMNARRVLKIWPRERRSGPPGGSEARSKPPPADAEPVAKVLGEDGGVAARDRHRVADVGEARNPRRSKALKGRNQLDIPGSKPPIAPLTPTPPTQDHVIARLEQPGGLVAEQRGRGNAAPSNWRLAVRRPRQLPWRSRRDDGVGGPEPSAKSFWTPRACRRRACIRCRWRWGRKRVEQIHPGRNTSPLPQVIAWRPTRTTKSGVEYPTARRSMVWLASSRHHAVLERVGQVEGQGRRRRGQQPGLQPGWAHVRADLPGDQFVVDLQAPRPPEWVPKVRRRLASTPRCCPVAEHSLEAVHRLRTVRRCPAVRGSRADRWSARRQVRWRR